jgi:hypothetical protein
MEVLWHPLKRLLQENRDWMPWLKALMKYENTIDAEQIEDIMNGLAPRKPKASRAVTTITAHQVHLLSYTESAKSLLVVCRALRVFHVCCACTFDRLPRSSRFSC